MSSWEPTEEQSVLAHAGGAVPLSRQICASEGSQDPRFRRPRTASPAATAPVTPPATAPASDPDAGRFSAGPVVVDLPAGPLGVGAQPGVGVDGAADDRPSAASAGRWPSRSTPRSGPGRAPPAPRGPRRPPPWPGRAAGRRPAGRCRRRPRARRRCRGRRSGPSRRAMIEAISIGAAVTSQTRWPWSRCSWASARVPGQIRRAIASSKISSPSCSSSSTVCPSMKLRAEARASATWSGSSTPTMRNLACFQAAAAISPVVKNRRR